MSGAFHFMEKNTIGRRGAEFDDELEAERGEENEQAARLKNGKIGIRRD